MTILNGMLGSNQKIPLLSLFRGLRNLAIIVQIACPIEALIVEQ